MGFMDDKDTSRTIRTGFTDVMVVSHDNRGFTERCFLMDETLRETIRDSKLGFLQWHFLQFEVIQLQYLGNFTHLL